jgi:hypothetical protein
MPIVIIHPTTLISLKCAKNTDHSTTQFVPNLAEGTRTCAVDHVRPPITGNMGGLRTPESAVESLIVFVLEYVIQ